MPTNPNTAPSSPLYVKLIHYIPRLPNQDAPSLFDALRGSLRDRIATRHPDAEIQVLIFTYGGKWKPELSGEENIEALMNVCFHCALSCAHASNYQHKPDSVVTYTFFWLCNEPDAERRREPQQPCWFTPASWDKLAEHALSTRIDLKMYVITTEGQFVPNEMLCRCWPIPTDTLFAPPKESERTDDSDNPKPDIDTKTSDASSDEPDLNKVITYGFGALGLSKHQNYFQLWEPTLGDDPVVYM